MPADDDAPPVGVDDRVADGGADEELAELELAAAAHEHAVASSSLRDELRVVRGRAGGGVHHADVGAGAAAG